MTDQDNKLTVTATQSDGFPHKIVPGLTSIIIPIYIYDYSLMHYTGHTIGSIREHTDREKTPYEIVVVDNGSSITLPDPKMYKAEKYTRNETNEGVTKAWNKGIRISQGEFICIANNDIMVFSHWLEDMLEALQQVDLVMATPMYGEPFARALESATKREEWMKRMLGDSLSDFKDFSCVIARRSLFDEIGLFDEQFFNYASDTDLMKRMDVVGKKYASNKRVPIFHIINATSVGMPETPQQMNEDKEKYRIKWTQEKKLSSQDIAYSTPDDGRGVNGVEENNIAAASLGQPGPTATGVQLNHPNPSPSVPEVAPEPEPTIDNMPRFVRTSDTGDKIYFVKEGKMHWVTNPKVYEALGGAFGVEKNIKRELFVQLERGEPVTLENVSRFQE